MKQQSREGLEAARSELVQREKVQEELQSVRVWLEAADGLLSEMERSNSTQELQVRQSINQNLNQHLPRQITASVGLNVVCC